MMRRILETLVGFAVLAGLIFGLSYLPVTELSRVSRVQSTRPTKVVCVLAAVDATIYIDNADTAAPLGWGAYQVTQLVHPHQAAAMVAHGAQVPRGGAHNSFDALASFVPCTRPISEGVLALPATADTELRLVNPDQTEAAVDLTLYGVDGEIQSLGARGIALAPNEERTIALSVLTSEATPVGVSIKASRGRAAVAAVTQNETRASATVPSTLSQNHLLPGIPAGATGATVVLANPTDQRISANLTVYGSTPAYVPAGGSDISVAPFSSVSIPIEGSLGQEASAVSVSASAPLIAGLSFVQGDAAEVAPVQASTELAAFTVPGGTLQLSNPGSEAATVEVRVEDVAGNSTTESMEVPAGQTAVLELPAEMSQGQRVLVTSDQELFGAVVTVGEAGTWAAPLEEAKVVDPEPIAAELEPLLR